MPINEEELSAFLAKEAEAESATLSAKLKELDDNLKHARQRKSQAESELASIPNRGRWGHMKDQHEQFAEQELTAAEADIAKWEAEMTAFLPQNEITASTQVKTNESQN
jgi:hypothetical protein